MSRRTARACHSRLNNGPGANLKTGLIRLIICYSSRTQGGKVNCVFFFLFPSGPIRRPGLYFLDIIKGCCIIFGNEQYGYEDYPSDIVLSGKAIHERKY